MKARALAFLAAIVIAATPLRGQNPQREPDFDRQIQQQAETDKTWRAASDGVVTESEANEIKLLSKQRREVLYRELGFERAKGE